ncbi:cobalamin biosynthesis protein [Methanocella sp. CWC-04]|uniref:Cobalamin biosynthesis protein n=1 Tax=Methanooceanicella nereidis TaxID=2052831 RepID=A0AAP2RDR9_9EURY|nr:PDGLE domain-containing protein [Methanocella sp. CWC-04]MCD1295252.1 cobalamin biosynthesis protein [Methanocella sp. CWC-04]
MDKTLRNLIIALAILIILVPLGLIATGETFGEWGSEELEEKIGYLPSGLEELSSFWNYAPLPDYGFADNDTTVGAIIGYILSAVVGVILCGGTIYVIGKLVAKNETE